MCTPSAVRARVCHAAPSQLTLAQERREFDRLCMQPCLLHGHSERSLGSTAPASPKGEAAAASSGHRCAAAEAAGEDTRHGRESSRAPEKS